MDLKDLIQQAQRPETTVPLCLRGDLVAEWERRERELRDRRNAPNRTLAGNDVTELAKEVAALEDQMRESTVEFRLRAVHRREWMQLLADHPPREGNQFDKGLGLNSETFYDALVTKCLVEPELSAEELAAVLDVLTAAQFDRLTASAWALNSGDVSVPFSQTASLIITTSEETSRRPSDSGSPTSGSAGGSRKKSSRTSTTKQAG